MSVSSTQWWVLFQHEKELESVLSSTAGFSHLLRKLQNNKVLSEDFSGKITSLDQDLDHLEPEIKVRYLLQHVLERVREDGKVFKRLVGALKGLGGKIKDECDAMSRHVARESTSSREEENEIQLVTKDVPYLMKCLVLCSHLWEELGIALDIPQYKRDDCKRNSDKNIIRLESLLRTYVQGDYEGARPATLYRLKEALAGDIVKQKVAAFKLEMPTRESDNPFPNTSSCKLEILEQSYYTEVAEGKSTLLEVQVSGRGCESYQWSKDGQPLLEGADFSGVSSDILYINKASKCAEGNYSCRISRGDETECSEEISLSVEYPPGKEELIKLYFRERKLAINSWPPTRNSEFINLALIKQQKKDTSTCDYYTVRGDMDDILESKEEAVYEEVFSEYYTKGGLLLVEYKEVFREYREGGLLLVEGRPGCGKTTLVHKITRDWAEGKKVLQGARMVFLVTLRLVNESGKDKTLLDLLQIFYGNVLNKDIEHDLQKNRGKGACFILDGLDEYPIEKKKNSVIDELLNTRTLLPDSMVIVASRPVAAEELKQRCNTRIEVIGFHKDQIYSYVRSYPFHNSGMAVKMEKYLHQHPNVLHMCYLPVHAAMICFLFSKLNGNIPHTETQIYEQFTIATILRHEANKSEGLSQLKSLLELSGEEKTLFNSVCKLAYDMIINSQQVVRKSDAQISVSSNLYFGLLTVEHTSEYYGSEDLYTFHHLTFQEFLAAFYMHKAQIEDEQLIEKYSLRNVFKFYCGLTQLFNNIKFVTLICERLKYRDSFHIRCAFESQHVEVCDFVVDNDEIYVEGDIVSSIALGYILSKCTKPVTKMIITHKTWDREGVESFASMATSDKLQSIKYLSIGVSKPDDKLFVAINILLAHLPFLEELDLSGILLKKSRIECLTNGIKLPQLKVLRICLSLLPPCSQPEEVLKLLTFKSKNLEQIFYQVYIYYPINYMIWRKILSNVFGCHVIQDSDLSWLHLYDSQTVPSLPHERLSHCIEVVLVNCCIGDEETKILASTLNTSVLEKLGLDFNRISDSGAVTLAGCLERCSVVQAVSIQCNSIGDSGATALADALVHCNSLKILNLQGNSLGDKGAVAVAKATEDLPSLILILHNVNITEEGIKRVLEHRARTHIRNVELTSSWECVSEADVDSLRRALQCGNLPTLRLSKTNISNIDKLVAEQEHVKNVRRIECYDITNDTVPILCSILKSLPNISYLILNDLSKIQSSSAHLSDCLKTCKSLHHLALRRCYHPSMFLAVKCFTKLHSLELRSCSLDSEGVGGLLCSNAEFWVNLHTLNLRNSGAVYLNSDAPQVHSEILVHCKSLRCLDLSCNQINDSGLMAIVKALKDHTGLLELSLGDNKITSEGVAALSQVIGCNQQLQCLDLKKCNLGPEGVATLVDVMCGDSLQTLNLRGTELGDDGMACLSVGLKKFTQLVQLDINDNNISSHGVACLSEGLQYCIRIEKLSLKKNNIASDGMASLFEGLRYCTKLQELDISDNKVSSNGISAILDIMKSCKYLKYIGLHDNSISMDDAAVLVGGWQHKSLLTLSLSNCKCDDHESALKDGSKHCDSCDRLLQLYYSNDYVQIGMDDILPKLLSI